MSDSRRRKRRGRPFRVSFDPNASAEEMHEKFMRVAREHGWEFDDEDVPNLEESPAKEEHEKP